MLRGGVAPDNLARLRQCLDAGEFFIAEQLGLPPLYAELWSFSGGPTDADHVWHTFHALRLAEAEEVVGSASETVEDFISRIEAISQWDEKLSLHWGI